MEYQQITVLRISGMVHSLRIFLMFTTKEERGKDSQLKMSKPFALVYIQGIHIPNLPMNFRYLLEQLRTLHEGGDIHG